MKKLTAIILLLALLLPAAALAADPIVGCWYFHADLKKNPEMKATYGECDSISDLYFFDESGVISGLEAIIMDGKSTPTFVGAGKWEKNLFGYNVSIVGFGQTTMTVNGDEALLKIPNASVNVSLRLRRLIPFDMYNDYVY